MAEQQRPAVGTAATAVVRLPAEIDMTNADQVEADLLAAVAPEVTTVVADMTATAFCDVRGVRGLVQAQKRAAASGAELRLAVPSATVSRVMTILGADAVLAIYPGLEQALADGTRSAEQ
jgi:anti-anti-sigma factor